MSLQTAIQQMARILTRYANVPAKEALLLAQASDEEVTYTTEAVLWADTPAAGTLGYAADTGRLWLRNSSAWVPVDPNVSAGDITVAVSTTGSDTPTAARPARIVKGDYSAAPFATIQAAIDACPSRLGGAHAININVGAGNFAGFVLAGKDYGNNQNYPFNIVGTRVAATIATGPLTGTLTSASGRLLTLTGAGWTTDNLVGKHLRVTAGAGSGQILAIAANTADTITLGQIPTALNNTSQFALEESATIITSLGASTISAVRVRNVSGQVRITDLKVAVAGYGGFAVLNSTEFYLIRCVAQWVSGTFRHAFLASQQQSLSLDNCVALGAFYNGLSLQGLQRTVGLQGTVISGAETGISANSGGSFQISAGGAYVRNCTVAGFAFGGLALAVVYDTIVDACATAFTMEHTALTLARSTISNSTTAAFSLLCCAMNWIGAIAGSGNAGWGLKLRGVGNCLHLGADAAPTITGASGELTVDGTTPVLWSALAASNAYTADPASGARAHRI